MTQGCRRIEINSVSSGGSASLEDEEEVPMNVLLVAVSGYGQDADRLRAWEAGFDHHLTKPIEFGALEKILSTMPRRTDLDVTGVS